MQLTRTTEDQLKEQFHFCCFEKEDANEFPSQLIFDVEKEHHHLAAPLSAGSRVRMEKKGFTVGKKRKKEEPAPAISFDLQEIAGN